MHNTPNAALLAFTLLSLSAPGQAGRIVTDQNADIIKGAHPGKVLEIAKGFGSAELETDSDGDPKISGRIDGAKYAIVFYGCSAGEDCTHVQLVAGWSGGGKSLDDINHWNRSTKFGKAYLDDEGDPWIEMTVNLTHGVTRKNLDDTFDWWQVALSGFRKSFEAN